MPQIQLTDLEKAQRIVDEMNPQKINDLWITGEISTQDRRLALEGYGRARRDIEQTTGVKEIDQYITQIKDRYGKLFDQKTGDTDILQAALFVAESMNALNIPGDVVERKLAEAGMPGLGYAANWLIWAPLNFVSLGTLLAPVTKGLGAVARTIPKAIKPMQASFLKFLATKAREVQKGAIEGADLGKVAEAMIQGEKVSGKIPVAAEAVAPAKRAAVFTSGKEPQAVSEEVVRRGREFVSETEQSDWLDTLSKSMNVDREAAEKMMEAPEKLNDSTVQLLIDRYRQKYATHVNKPITHAEQAQAQLGRSSFEELKTRAAGQAASAPEIKEMAYVADEIAKGLKKAIDEAKPHLDAIRQGGAPDIVSNIQNHWAALSETAPPTLGVSTLTGQALEIHKTIQPELQRLRLWDNAIRGLAPEQLAHGEGPATAAMIERLALLTDAGEKELMQKMAQEAATSTSGQFWDKARRWFKSLLLLPPATQISNIVGGLQGSVGKIVDDLGAAALPFTKDTQSMHATFSELAGFLGMTAHMPGILKRAKDLSLLAGRKYEASGLAEDIVGSYGPLRWNGFMDELVGGWLENAMAIGQFTDEALKSGLKGKSLDDYVRKQLLDTDRMMAFEKEVSPMIDEALFRQDLGQIGESLSNLSRHTGLGFFVPFMKTYTNLQKSALSGVAGPLSPRFWRDVAAGGAREASARGRLIMSYMFAQTIFHGVDRGLITGGGPIDPQENDRWRKAGNNPYSFGSFPYRPYEPIASIIGAYADFRHQQNLMTQESADEMMGALLLAGERMIENNQWLRVMENLTQLVTGVKRGIEKPEDLGLEAAKVVLQPPATVATGGPIGSRLREILDPEVKDIQSVSDFLAAKIPPLPGLREVVRTSRDVNPRLNYSGEPMLIPEPLLGRWANLFTSNVRRPVKNDPVAEFMQEYELTLPDNDWDRFGGSFDPQGPMTKLPRSMNARVNLSGDEAYNHKLIAYKNLKISGKNWVQSVLALRNDPDWKIATRPERQQQLNDLRSEFREEAQDAMKKLFPAVQQKADLAEKISEAFDSGGEQSVMELLGATPEAAAEEQARRIEYVPEEAQ